MYGVLGVYFFFGGLVPPSMYTYIIVRRVCDVLGIFAFPKSVLTDNCLAILIADFIKSENLDWCQYDGRIACDFTGIREFGIVPFIGGGGST